MKRLICAIILLVGVYAVSIDARESRGSETTNSEDWVLSYDTVWTVITEDSVGERMPREQWYEAFSIECFIGPPTEYLHTDIKIFHGPTAQSVLDYFRAWEDSADVEIVGSVSSCVPAHKVDTLIPLAYTINVEQVGPHAWRSEILHRDSAFWPEYDVDTLTPTMWEVSETTRPEIHYLTVTYREWREETR